MYAAGGEHPYKAPSFRILEWASRSEIRAVTSSEVHQEILHRFLALRLPVQACQLSEHFQRVVTDVLAVTIQDVARARALTAAYPDLPARDLIHVAVMLNHDISEIVTADRHFDSVAEVRRIDPLSFTP
jgi:predicted nucleic acid-binding protein